MTIDGNGVLDKSNPTVSTTTINETTNSAREILIGEGITAINIFLDGVNELENLETVNIEGKMQ